MAGPAASAVVTVLPTAALSAGDLRGIRRLMDASFGDFTDDDWAHALGGLHAIEREFGEVVAHGALVPRTLWVAGTPLRTGYVEAVAVREDVRRLGLGGRIMGALEAHARDHDLLALSSSAPAVPFYESRGWTVWRGPSAVLDAGGPEPTPDDDGAIFVWGAEGLDLDAQIVCDPRPGDVW